MGSIRPHAVCLPYPAQGHINPMLQLAKLLHHQGFHITFVNTAFNHRRLQKSRQAGSLPELPSFRFETIPDGLPPSDADATQDIPSLCESTTKTCLGPFKELLARLNGDSATPPVSCIVSDGVMSFTLAAGDELGVPVAFLWTISACGFLGYMHYAQLMEKGYTPFKGQPSACLSESKQQSPPRPRSAPERCVKRPILAASQWRPFRHRTATGGSTLGGYEVNREDDWQNLG